MVGFLVFSSFALGREGGLVNKIDFTAEEGFDSVFLGLFEKAGKTVKDAVIGDGKGLHAHFCGAGAKAVDSRTSVQKAVIGMDVEVDEFAVFFWHVVLIWSLVRGWQGQAAGRAKFTAFGANRGR